VAAQAYQSVPLTAQHDLKQFSCGQAELDTCLSQYALHAAAMNTARIFVWAETKGVVVGYYSLSAHQLASEGLPRVARGGPRQIPAVLIGKLALDERLQGNQRKLQTDKRRLGDDLLVDALGRVLVATQQVAARLVVVDAIDDRAVKFYERFGFVRTAPDSSRLVRKISDIAAAFDDVGGSRDTCIGGDDILPSPRPAHCSARA